MIVPNNKTIIKNIALIFHSLYSLVCGEVPMPDGAGGGCPTLCLTPCLTSCVGLVLWVCFVVVCITDVMMGFLMWDRVRTIM